ncbi:MAG: hypothetical protein P8P74_12030 [Crocinitomicaceae bacterium]|nr:hypothetical protein [Crocinitomicaceae bacterium]
MAEVLDSNTHSLVHLVEEYIARKRNRVPLGSAYFRSELKRIGYSPDQIQDLLIEMDDDADKELLAGDGVKKAKQKLIISLLVGILGMSLSIAGAVSGVFGVISFGLIIIPFGLIGATFVVAGKAYAEIGLVNKRKKRRFLKYQKWI